MADKSFMNKIGRFSATARLQVLVFVILMCVYSATLLPGIGSFGDTPKFQFLGRVLGIPHSTGYPLYLLLNHIFVTFLPFGQLAWKANLLSAIFAALACAVFLRLLLIVGVGRWIAVAGGLLMGLSGSVWSQSIKAEVYSLHLLLVALIVFFLVRWRLQRQDRDLLLAVLYFSLSLGHHMTTLLLLPAALYLLLVTQPRLFVDVKFVGASVLLVVLGILQYAYLFWRTSDPTTPYVEVPVSDLRSLWAMISGAGFRQEMFPFSIAQFVTERLPLLGMLLYREFMFILPFVVWGFLRFPDRVIGWFLAIYCVANGLWAVNYNVVDVFVFLIPSFFVLIIFASVGLHCATNLPVIRRFGAPVVLAILIPVAFLLVNWGKVDQSKNTGAQKAIESILRAVDSNAVLISPDYHWSQYFWYYLIGEDWGRRNLYVMHHFSPSTVKAYLSAGKPFALPERRRQVPVGLAVYCFSDWQRDALLGEGLAAASERGSMYRITIR